MKLGRYENYENMENIALNGIFLTVTQQQMVIFPTCHIRMHI